MTELNYSRLAAVSMVRTLADELQALEGTVPAPADLLRNAREVLYRTDQWAKTPLITHPQTGRRIEMGRTRDGHMVEVGSMDCVACDEGGSLVVARRQSGIDSIPYPAVRRVAIRSYEVAQAILVEAWAAVLCGRHADDRTHADAMAIMDEAIRRADDLVPPAPATQPDQCEGKGTDGSACYGVADHCEYH